MPKFIVTTIMVLLLTNCAAEAGGPWNNQYCNVETLTLATNDNKGEVITMEKVVCNDGVKDFLAYSGIAKECSEFWFDILLNNSFIKRKGYVCQKFDGSWEIVSNPK